MRYSPILGASWLKSPATKKSKGIVMGPCDRCDMIVSVAQLDGFFEADNGLVQVFAVCPLCRTENQFVFSPVEWKIIVRRFEASKDEVDLTVKVFAFDLETVDGVDDFLVHAGPSAPLELTRACGCGRCGS